MTDADYEDDNENEYEPQNTREHKIQWLEAEKEAFSTLRDVNGDGFLDLVEVMLRCDQIKLEKINRKLIINFSSETIEIFSLKENFFTQYIFC